MSKLLEHIIRNVLFEDEIEKWLPREKQTKIQLFQTETTAAAEAFGAVSAFDIFIKMKMRGKKQKNIVRLYRVINYALSDYFFKSPEVAPYATKDNVFIVSNPTSDNEQYVTVWVVPIDKLAVEDDEKIEDPWPKPEEVKKDFTLLTDKQIIQVIKNYKENTSNWENQNWDWPGFNAASINDKRTFKIDEKDSESAISKLYAKTWRLQLYVKDYDQVQVVFPFVSSIGDASITTYQRVIQRDPNLAQDTNFTQLQQNTKNVVNLDTMTQRRREETPNWKIGWPSNIHPKKRWYYFPKDDKYNIFKFNDTEMKEIYVAKLKNYKQTIASRDPNIITTIPVVNIDDNIVNAMLQKIKKLS
tara:strand:- start:167 stop:1240 length:1074 start_codon:yes stop_codon:yes gene_type:complete